MHPEVLWGRHERKVRRMRPILKRSGRTRSPGQAAPTPSPSKHKEFTSPSGRRVTFSPFAKRRLPPKRLQKDLDDSTAVNSGFAFNGVIEREKRRQARRMHDMSVMQTLYQAARKPRQGWQSIIEEHVEVLKHATTRVKKWLRVLQHPFSTEAARLRNRRVVRSRVRHAPPIYFDTSDRQYVQSVSAPLLPPTSLIALEHAHRSMTIEVSRTAVTTSAFSSSAIPASSHPSLIPIHHGSLSSLLRREGIPAVEDERYEQAAVKNDLRGVTHRAAGLAIIPHSQELRLR